MIKMLSSVVEEKPAPPPAPESGLFDIPNYSFSTAKNSFCFNSFLNKPEIIKAVVLVRKESAKVLSTRLFVLPTKSTRLDEFSSSQSSSISNFSSFVKETWSSAVISHVKQQLKDVSKGWFNLEESNTEVYKFSKLRKFLGFLNFIMQDTLRFAVEDSLLNYKKFIFTACAPPVTITSTNEVSVDFSLGGTLTEDAARLRSRKPPLFLLDLAIDTTTGDLPVFGYSSSSSSFTSTVLQFFDKSLISIQKLIRIERKVMKNLFWSRDPVMNTVHPSEDWVSVYR